ncbi:tRNA (guanosine(46)-N7)-methyltransferase TrmB [Carboxylicivirga marina]|uniref:tRNA (guanine-N(7)-)-methyltransferase n=1 Tax=Carboxylicivirga marina TaxID=2800988 RepID=A0ABS1HJT1_9BACT|nr:tRNA (guanosine(46)-N7)-methyltransferase TrmB [Carboxylicivirga marina]MBK3517934.1 tRNA (guanosine(46)-N7)-methyltransferase TrmB [Carboxylicivirga marina]
MGKNKLKKFVEMATYDHVFEADFSDLKGEPFHQKGKWHQRFFNNENPIVLELGCGKGEYTVGLAELFPDKNFIGVDIKGARMHRGATDAKNKGLKNVAFVRTRIEFITAFFAENEVEEIWLTFPDPQMKKVNKRLSSTRFLQMYRQFLKLDGLMHLKTDSNFLYTYTSEMVKENGFKVEVAENDLYGSGYDDEILSIQTHYESKWIKHGLSIKYLKFHLENREQWIEPDIEIEFDEYHSAGRGVVKEKDSIINNPLSRKKGK